MLSQLISIFSRPFTKDDGLMYYLLNKPGKIIKRVSTSNQKKEYNLRYLICVTMYNEKRDELLSTLKGIYENIPNFINAGICSEEIAVCVICDGILSLDNTCVEYFQKLDKRMNNPVISVTGRLKQIKEEHEKYIKEVVDEKEQQKRRNDICKTLPNSVPRKTSIVYQTRISGDDFRDLDPCCSSG